MASLASLASLVQRVVLVQQDKSAAKVSRAIPVSLVLLGQLVPLAQVDSLARRVDRDRKVRKAALDSQASQARVARSVL